MNWNELGLIEINALVTKIHGSRLIGQNLEKYAHLYLPWEDKGVPDLMFQFKNILKHNGRCFIPIMFKNLEPTILPESSYHFLRDQISRGVETHLYMSNSNSIHTWRVKNVFYTEEVSEIESLTPSFIHQKGFYQWVEVDDLFVFNTSHLHDCKDVFKELEALCASQKNSTLFESLQEIRVIDGNHQKVVKKSWVESDRSVTYDYHVRLKYLEENIYSGTWGNFNLVSQHYLVLVEQIRHQAIMEQSHDTFSELKDAFEYYNLAILSELDDIFLRPLRYLYFNYSSMQEAWAEIQNMGFQSNYKKILDELFQNQDSTLESLDTFMKYIEFAKSFLYSMKSKFAKKIGKEEYLMIENFLLKQENLVESFLSRKLNFRLLDIQFLHQNFFEKEMDTVSRLKLSHIISLLTSSRGDDNIFYKLLEVKTMKSSSLKDLADEITQLKLELDRKKSAA